MPLNYLTLDDAVVKANAFNLFRGDRPSDLWLNEVLEIGEETIDSWLSHKFGKRQYQEKGVASEDGEVFLRQCPVLEILKVSIYLPDYPNSPPGASPIDLEQYEGFAVWLHRNSIWVAYPRVVATIDYIAGIEPIPPEVERVAFNLFRFFLENTPPGDYPDTTALNAPTRDMTSLSLPGGLSRSFQLGSSSDESRGVPGTGSILDRLMQPLKKYRRLYVL
jgi:hypothetical protein